MDGGKEGDKAETMDEEEDEDSPSPSPLPFHLNNSYDLKKHMNVL